ncbi:PorT family protein [Salinimicrobium sp. CDJ15-81-2]|nr:PorT family protein [Salinimicrobium nanhaiense]
MKKSVLFIAAMVFSTTFVAAQEFVYFGVKGGVNISTVTGDDFDSPEERTSFNVGLLAEIPLTQRFSLQPEVYYSGQGFDAAEIDQDNVFDTDENVEFQLDYINVPILAKFYLVDGLSLQAGPSFNFKVNEEIDYQPTNNAGDRDFDEVKDFEFGGAVGVEYKFNNGFLIQARYNHGFTELAENTDAYNSVFQAGVGFMF